MSKCEFHDESMKGLREDIHAVQACVTRIEKILHDNGGGLVVKVFRNSEYREKEEKKQERIVGNWERVKPNIVQGVVTAILIALAFILLPLLTKGGGLYECEQVGEAIKYSWLYDVCMSKGGSWYKATFTDIYWQVQDVSLQSNVLTFGKGIRLGGALLADHYGDWGLMGAVEIEYQKGWMKVETTYMTDLRAYRWHVLGDLSIPVGKRISIVPTIRYSGTEDLTVGRGKVILKYRF